MKEHVTERLQYLTLILVFIAAAAAFVFLVLQVRINRTRSQAACEATNVFADTELKLWNYILSLPPASTQKLTPEQQAEQDKRVADFKVYINKAFAQKECR